MDQTKTPELEEIKLLQKEKTLMLRFNNDETFQLPCEYLRVFSPSAEVQGHGVGEPKLIVGKENVNIIAMEPIGSYAIKLVFDDGHDTGLYGFEYLYELGMQQKENWEKYQKRLIDQASFSDY